MDSLLANYASSDEEQEENPQPSNPPFPKSTGSFLSSLPPPKSPSSSSSSSLFFSLPPPKSQTSNPLNPLKSNQEEEDKGHQAPQNLASSKLLPSPLSKPSSSSLFSSLPQPKSPSSSSSSSLFSSLPQPTAKAHLPDADIPPVPAAQSASRRVVQFRPPPPPANTSTADEDEDDEYVEEEKRKKQPVVQTSSVKSFLSSIPAPRNFATLGALHSASGTTGGRRSIIDADVPGLKESKLQIEDQSRDYQAPASSSEGLTDSSGYAVGGDYSSYANYDGYSGYENASGVSGDYNNWDGRNADSLNYSSDFGSYGNFGQYESSNWGDNSTANVVPELSGLPESLLRVSGKRGRNNASQEIVEVKQDELMKNRPREDQSKLTGIAFGPSYQPTSTKGKPSKLHKRKHQIGSLFFDMKQKEMELAERRSKGFLTKAQTQGKYGW